MENSAVTRISNDLKEILALLVSKKYDLLEQRTNGVRLSAHEIKNAIENYGRSLVVPPADAFKQLDLIEIRNSKPKGYSLRFDLWTEEEGRSDLSLEATVVDYGSAAPLRWELDDIHVL